LQLLIERPHHRIKNNLQMVSGLLQLEADAAVVDASKEFLRTAITRNPGDCPGAQPIERRDARESGCAYLDYNDHSHTRDLDQGASGTPEMTVEVEHLWLGADQAVPLALIVNELVSNSFLHGRPPAAEGLRVRIECRQQDGHVQLIVADNGGGFTDGKDWRECEGQGMNIVAQLAQVNLRGHLQSIHATTALVPNCGLRLWRTDRVPPRHAPVPLAVTRA